MTNPDPKSRCGSEAVVAAALTQLRASSANWRRNGEGAVLRTKGRTIELGPTDERLSFYQAYPASNLGAPFRRIPGSKPGSLDDVLRLL